MVQYPYGLSQDAIDILMKNPFLDENSALYIKDAPNEVFMQSPLLRQVHRILEVVSVNPTGLLLTDTKLFPNALKWELYRLGQPEKRVDDTPRVNLDENIVWNISIARAICLQAGLTITRRHRMLITKKGKALIDDKRMLLATIMNILCTRFNWGYRIEKPIVPSVHDGCAPLLLHLMEMDSAQTAHFYRVKLEKLYRPDLEPYGRFDKFRSDEELDTRVSIYLFERFLWQLGFVDISSGKYYSDDGLMKIRRSRLFDELIGLRQ